MDKTVLVERDIDGGRRIVEALDEADFPLVAALWLYLPEPAVWRLFLASSAVDEQGPRHAYSTIQSVVDKLLPPVTIDLDDISAVGEYDPLVSNLRIFAGTDGKPFVGGVGLSKAVVGDVYVENAYIYRAQRVVGKSGDLPFVFAIPALNGKGKRWSRREGVVVAKNGFLVDIRIDGHEIKHSQGRHGVNAIIYVVKKAMFEGGKLYGDIDRWHVLDGRLRNVEEVASHAEMVE